MNGYLSFIAGVASGLLIMALAVSIARFVLMRWFFDRQLAVASLACGAAFALGRFVYSGPLNTEAWNILGALVGSALCLWMIGTIWLRRHPKETVL